MICSALDRFITQIDADRGDEVFHDLFLAYALARGAGGVDMN
jgi:hypothetical protein